MVDEKAKEHLKKNYSILIKYKDTAFIFPAMFAKYIELEELHHTQYLDEIESFFIFVKQNQNFTLHLFLTSFFYYLQRIHVKLSQLEIQVLKLLTTNHFMFYSRNDENSNENYRIYPPTYLEIYQELKTRGVSCSKRTIQQIKTNLFTYQICYERRTFVNFSKVGFIYVFIERIKEIPEPLVDYTLWEIQCGSNKDLVVCVPFGNIDVLLQDIHYEILDQFHFNVNIKQYDRKKQWTDFKVPFQELLSLEQLPEENELNTWDIQPLQKSEFEIDQLNVELLDSIVKSNTSNIIALSRLSEKITKNHIEKRLQKLAKYGFFSYNPQVNFLGIDLVLCLKIKIKKDKQHLLNVINFFSYFPEVMMFSSNELVVVYIRVPRNITSDLLKNIYLFNLLFKNDKKGRKSIFVYSQDYYTIKNSIYVLDRITYQNNVAKIID